MGSNNLVARSDGQTVQSADVNQYRTGLIGDLVPRNTSGSPEASQGSLGTNSLPWKDIYMTGQFVKNGNVVDFSSFTGESHQIVSGAALTSGYPDFLTFVASSTTGRILGASTNLVLIINNASVTLASNIDVTGLTLGPTANHTCLVNDPTLSGQDGSRLLGEDGSFLAVDTIGSAISALNGTIQVFQKGSEYFLAYVDTSNNKLWPFKRGIAKTDRETLSDNDTITLRQGNYIFLDADGSTTYKTTLYPSFANTEPSSPASNQWNFNTSTKRWERYSGSWSNMSAHWLGTVICDGSAAVAADANDFNLNWKSSLVGSFTIMDSDTLRVYLRRLNVAGRDFYLSDFGQTIKLSVSGDRESGVSESASTYYYVYADNNLKLRFSTIPPRYSDLRLGLYHPKQYWRYLGHVFNDGSSNLVSAIFDGNSRASKLYAPALGILNKNSAYTLLDTDIGALAICTGTFTLSLTAANLLGSGWYCFIRNDGTGVITIAGTVDGETNILVNPGEGFILTCDGGNFKTVGRNPRAQLSDQTITLSGTLTLAHGLGKTPLKLEAVLVCQVADGGYQIGDVVSGSFTGDGSPATAGYGVNLWADATNVYAQYGSGGFLLNKRSATVGNATTITNSSWKLRITAKLL